MKGDFRVRYGDSRGKREGNMKRAGEEVNHRVQFDIEITFFSPVYY